MEDDEKCVMNWLALWNCAVDQTFVHFLLLGCTYFQGK